MSNIEIIEFVEPSKVNPYIDAVTNLSESGEGHALSISVPVKDFTRERNLVAKAANSIGKTARLREKHEDGEEIVLTFTLTDKHKPRRGGAE